MKLRFPPTRYRVVRDKWLGYEAQFKVWWWPFWVQCHRFNGGCGANTNKTLEQAHQLCADHHRRRQHPTPVGQIVARFSARELEAQADG